MSVGYAGLLACAQRQIWVGKYCLQSTRLIQMTFLLSLLYLVSAAQLKLWALSKVRCCSCSVLYTYVIVYNLMVERRFFNCYVQLTFKWMSLWINYLRTRRSFENSKRSTCKKRYCVCLLHCYFIMILIQPKHDVNPLQLYKWLVYSGRGKKKNERSENRTWRITSHWQQIGQRLLDIPLGR